MSSNADTPLEPQVETASAGPKLAETETQLATEPVHGDKAVTSEETQGDEKADAPSAAPVRYIFPLRILENAVWELSTDRPGNRL
jgi:hypothetical protein